MQHLLAQQLSGDLFLPAMQFIVADSLILALVATAFLLRLVDHARLWTIAILCLTAIAGFSVLMATIGLDLIDSWNTTFNSVHIAVMCVGIALFAESITKIKRRPRQDTEPSASPSIS